MDREPVGYIVHKFQTANGYYDRAVGKGFYNNIDDAMKVCYYDAEPLHLALSPIKIDNGFMMTTITKDDDHKVVWHYTILNVY